jgi:hypothetical protein
LKNLQNIRELALPVAASCAAPGVQQFVAGPAAGLASFKAHAQGKRSGSTFVFRWIPARRQQLAQGKVAPVVRRTVCRATHD